MTLKSKDLCQRNETWLPNRLKNADGDTRKVGVEFELAGVPIEVLAKSVQIYFGGDVKRDTHVEYHVVNSNLGDFKIELDAASLQEFAEMLSNKGEEEHEKNKLLTQSTMDVITRAAEQVVPWEIVTPPIPVTRLHELESLVTALRDNGALGTKGALHYAFGLHLNPELPDLKAKTILNYIRAFFCLYNWIAEQEDIDSTRKITTYIKHFNKAYIDLVTDLNYEPPMEQLIEEYLQHNPTRNRSLDLLPLFAHIDADRVRKVVDDPRIKPRPTFHYRLPNCDICNPNWNLHFPWRLWLEVEKLANNPQALTMMCKQYRQELSRITHVFENRWLHASSEIVADLQRDGEEGVS